MAIKNRKQKSDLNKRDQNEKAARSGEDANARLVSRVGGKATGALPPDNGLPPASPEQAEQEAVPDEGAAEDVLVAFILRQREAERLLGIWSSRVQYRIGLAPVRLKEIMPHG